ncbi:MAG: ROK family transcriptional regulator, partial [Micrococcales bacterium]|nr:ROK family transcriptional regulator [Micrococcales bacterium]
MNRAAVQASLRQHNLALVLGEIAAAGPKPLSRAGIASATGITRATVSSLVDQLVAGGLIEELEPLVRPAAGRPPTPVVLASGRVAALGLEVNVDYLGVRVIDLTGDTLAQALVRVNSRGTSPQQTLGQLVKLADQVIDQLPSTVKLAGAGLAVPGLVAKDSVQLVVAPNLGWWNLDMAAQLTEAAVAGESQRLADLSARLLVANEANLAGLAHLRSGTLPDSSFLYLSGDVGIGAAVVIDGEALGGQHGWAGELGHVCVDPNGPVCTCGGTGCLETYAGKAALMQAAGLDPEASVLQLMEAASTPGP